MNQDKFVNAITGFGHVLCFAVAIILALGVMLGFPKLAEYILHMASSTNADHYTLFNAFLKHALLLIVGIEMITMLVTQSYKSLITLVMFVIARKMLVQADNMMDILLGCVALAIVFIVLKFILHAEKDRVLRSHIYSAAIHLNMLSDMLGVDLTKVSKAHTLGGFVHEMCKKQGVTIKDGAIVLNDTHEFKLVSTRDGVIDQVEIKSRKQMSEETDM